MTNVKISKNKIKVFFSTIFGIIAWMTYLYFVYTSFSYGFFTGLFILLAGIWPTALVIGLAHAGLDLLVELAIVTFFKRLLPINLDGHYKSNEKLKDLLVFKSVDAALEVVINTMDTKKRNLHCYVGKVLKMPDEAKLLKNYRNLQMVELAFEGKLTPTCIFVEPISGINLNVGDMILCGLENDDFHFVKKIVPAHDIITGEWLESA
jgi:hypothetical protein